MTPSRYVRRFNKETAPEGHNGSILAGTVLPEGMNAPFGHAWGYLEGRSAMEGHAHPTEEIYMILTGKGICGIDGEQFTVAPGDAVLIPPNAYHTMECAEGDTLLWAAFWWMGKE